jgi:adenylosuccinate synthase
MMMKSDVMDDFKTLKVATAYRYNGKETQHLPFAACTETMEPVYIEMPGWQQKIEGKIPQKLEDYIQFIEKYVGVPVKFVSYGPDRTQNVWR